MAFNLYTTPIAVPRSDNPASVLTRAKRALKGLGLSLRKGKEGESGPYQVVKGDLILGFGDAVDISQWAKEEVAKLPAPAKPAAAPAAAPTPAAADPAASFA